MFSVILFCFIYPSCGPLFFRSVGRFDTFETRLSTTTTAAVDINAYGNLRYLNYSSRSIDPNVLEFCKHLAELQRSGNMRKVASEVHDMMLAKDEYCPTNTSTDRIICNIGIKAFLRLGMMQYYQDMLRYMDQVRQTLCSLYHDLSINIFRKI